MQIQVKTFIKKTFQKVLDHSWCTKGVCIGSSLRLQFWQNQRQINFAMSKKNGKKFWIRTQIRSPPKSNQIFLVPRINLPKIRRKFVNNFYLTLTFVCLFPGVSVLWVVWTLPGLPDRESITENGIINKNWNISVFFYCPYFKHELCHCLTSISVIQGSVAWESKIQDIHTYIY